MKRAKSILAIGLSAVMILGLTACSSGSSSDSGQTAAAETEAVQAEASSEQSSTREKGAAEIALIMTATGEIDDEGLYQDTWEGINKFCDEYDYTCGYYNPSDGTADAFYATVEMAVANGALVVTVVGTGTVGMMDEVFEEYPDTVFICTELTNTEPSENSVMNIVNANESTFFAGVAAVCDGYTKLGVIGATPVPGVTNAMYGFIEGANWAANELGIDDVEIKTWYSNSFIANPDAQAYAASWFESGTELIMSCAGSGSGSVFAAAEAANKASIGCDVDMSKKSDTVLTSYLKRVGIITYDCLCDWENGTLQLDTTRYWGLEDGVCGIEIDNARFTTFTEEQYNEALDEYLSGNIDYTYGWRDAEDVAALAELIDPCVVTVIPYD